MEIKKEYKPDKIKQSEHVKLGMQLASLHDTLTHMSCVLQENRVQDKMFQRWYRKALKHCDELRSAMETIEYQEHTVARTTPKQDRSYYPDRPFRLAVETMVTKDE
jgi:hypothetical protein